jgi:hypothetical protein
VLVRAREALGEASEEWREAVRHLDGCDACRAEALAADPLLAFRRVGREADEAPAAREASIRSMRDEVRAINRSRRLAARRSAHRRRRIAAAAVLVGVLVALALLAPRNGILVRDAVVLDAALPVPAPSGPLAEPSPPSLVEDLDRPGARVYEMRRSGLSLAMIVDDTLDV